jgi:N-acetylneuraminic acid mutarotase
MKGSRSFGCGGVVCVWVFATACSDANPRGEDAGRRPDAPSSPDATSAPRWRDEPSLPVRWQETAGATRGDRLFVVGGYEDGQPTARVRSFAPGASRWTDEPALPVRLHHTAVVTVGGDLYALGGYRDDSFRAGTDAWVLRAGQTTWESVGELPEARGAATAGVIDGRIYLVGGFGVGQRLLTSVAVFDPSARSWRRARDLPTAREHLASVVHARRLWVFGGRLGGLSTNLVAVEVYDPDADVWEPRAPMPTARGGFAAAAVEGVAYVLGGEEPAGALASVDALDLTRGTWSSAPAMGTPRHGFVALPLGGRVWAVGGADRPLFAPISSVESLGP